MVATSFIHKCREEIIAAFTSFDLKPPEFLLAGPKGQEFLAATFFLQGREHRIEIAADIPMLYVGDRRLECYLREEFASEEAMAKAFALRLKRLLSGGSWDDS
jgi:hypothetical protein